MSEEQPQQPPQEETPTKKRKGNQAQVDAQTQTAAEGDRGIESNSKEVVESHAQLLEMQETERTKEDIKKLLSELGRYHANIKSQEKPGLNLKDKFGKTSQYYADIIEYMTYADDVFLGGDLQKQKRLLVLLTDPAYADNGMEKIMLEGLDPSHYTLNK